MLESSKSKAKRIGKRRVASNALLRAKAPLVKASLRDAVNEFIEEANKIHEAAATIKASEAYFSPFEAMQGFVKRESYILIAKYLRQGAHETLRKVSRYELRNSRQPEYDGNQFYWGLLGIDPLCDLIPTDVISLYAKQLLYAYRHSVPPEHLVGFLYQSGRQEGLRTRLTGETLDDEYLLVKKRTPDWPKR